MDKNIRLQITLFVDRKDAGEIEMIRRKFNPLQQQLIDSHVTLCRDDEVENVDIMLDILQNLDSSTIIINFGKVTRFGNDKGVLLPGSADNEQFHQLRKKVLTKLNKTVRLHEPHITLMHPRNSTCTDNVFEIIQSMTLPTCLEFCTISVIEQRDGGLWQIIKSFNLKSG